MSTDRITAASVLWNEAHRLPALLDVLQGAFERTLVIVQESSDDTLAIARSRQRRGDIVVEDEHRGTGDASMPLFRQYVQTPWTFVISGDERPSSTLLGTIDRAVDVAERDGADGVWIHFVSLIDGIDFSSEQDMHLRLYRSELEWPGTMHSRPTAQREIVWKTGAIIHDRSLDEMMRDYLRYYDLGKDNPNWARHNQLMMHDACVAIAGHKGWDYVTSFDWWSRVREVAFPS